LGVNDFNLVVGDYYDPNEILKEIEILEFNLINYIILIIGIMSGYF